MSNTQKKNVPELRFPGFEGEWEEKKLGDLIKVNSGKDYKHLDKGDIPVYGTGGYMTSVSEPLSEIDAVGIGRKGTINKPYLLEAPFWTVDTLFYCTPKKEADILFILSLFRKINWKLYDESTGVPSLSKQTINKINRLVPTNKEQQKIGEFFSKLDRQIELEEQKLELLQQQKKCYMQKIFSHELRFKDDNGNDYPEWEEKKLGELSQIVRGASPRPIKDPKWFNKESDIGWLRISDVTDQNGKIYHLEQKLSIEGQEKTRVLLTTHLLLSIAASIGKPVMNFVKTGVHDGFLIFLNPKFNIFFMYYWLDYFKEKWSKYGQPGSQVNLNSEIVKSQTLNMPSNHEQEKVGLFFNRNEKLIELQQEKIMYLKRRKQALIIKMFI
ncbi:TPA: restriction endonuclease subunit S [Staphylococcus aureus]|nr:restriction endonuclease subunit S [Staphylococcus aureus]HCZ8873265.1 restriction endonuclease subunit S [Staphylococcus aureus]HDJ1897042.1 restriction endonuclease subunit S [Staphylococcus aureus]HDY9914606.1 restriction endonuclease subunit S [Staphylococcus aureus]